MSSVRFGQHMRLSALAQQSLRQIVLECVRRNDLGRYLDEESTVSATIELIEHGFVRLVYDPVTESYWLEVTE